MNTLQLASESLVCSRRFVVRPQETRGRGAAEDTRKQGFRPGRPQLRPGDGGTLEPRHP